jgi:hypothetical protein
MRRFLAVLALALAAAPGYAEPKHGHGKGRGHEDEVAVSEFAAADRSAIASYYRGRGLPPGLEKQLRRNGTLPPGLQKKLAPFPAEVETRLPPCPPEVRRGMVGGVAVMYNSRTGLVLDAFVIAGR